MKSARNLLPVKAGPRNARAKEKTFGRPRAAQVDAHRVAELRRGGLSSSQESNPRCEKGERSAIGCAACLPNCLRNGKLFLR